MLVFIFQGRLGLNINLAKSELVLVGNVGNLEGLACIIGCKISSLSMKYLGLLGACFKANSIWDGIIRKIECCLAGWKWLYLSKKRKKRKEKRKKKKRKCAKPNVNKLKFQKKPTPNENSPKTSMLVENSPEDCNGRSDFAAKH